MLYELQRIIEFIINGIFHIWPYLVITIPIAVIVNLSGASKYINKALKKRPMTAILFATIIGAFSPFCSCGVIPVIASLLMGGVPLAPVMSFWLASPSMDPEIFFLSVSVLGWNLAVWRLASTFIMSLSAGYITHVVVNKGWLGNNYVKFDYKPAEKSALVLIKNFITTQFNKLKPVEKKLSFADVNAGVVQPSCGCTSKPKIKRPLSSLTNKVNRPKTFKEKCAEKMKSKSFREELYKEIVKATILVAKFMILAFFLEALIVFYVPSDFIVGLLGKDNPLAIITAALVGIPVYTSSIPALAMMGGLLEQGMAPAAALAFLIAGPTTTIPAMAAVWNLVSKRVFALYVLFTMFCAVVMGYLYQLITIL